MIDKKIMTIFILAIVTTVLLSLMISDYIIDKELESSRSQYESYMSKVDQMMEISKEYESQKEIEINKLMERVDSSLNKEEKDNLSKIFADYLDKVDNQDFSDNKSDITNELLYKLLSKDSNQDNSEELYKFMLDVIDKGNDKTDDILKDYLRASRDSQEDYYNQMSEILAVMDNITLRLNSIPYIIVPGGVS